MKVRQLSALAQAGIAAGLTTALEVDIVLGMRRLDILEKLRLTKFLIRGIGRKEAGERGLLVEVETLQLELQFIAATRKRL